MVLVGECEVLLYYHTKHVLTKQNIKWKKEENEIEDDVNDSQDDDLEEVDNLNSID